MGSCLGHTWGSAWPATLSGRLLTPLCFPLSAIMSLTTRWPSCRNGTTRALVLCCGGPKVMKGGGQCQCVRGWGVKLAGKLLKTAWGIFSVSLCSAPLFSSLPHPYPLPLPYDLTPAFPVPCLARVPYIDFTPCLSCPLPHPCPSFVLVPYLASALLLVQRSLPLCCHCILGLKCLHTRQ